MRYLRIFQALDIFRGRRNAVFTIFFPQGTSVQVELEKMARRIKAIKHANKRFEIMHVVECIQTHPANNSTKIVNDNGKIICAGLSTRGEVEYYELIPPNKIVVFEYYYDFFFYMHKIREIWYADTIKTLYGDDVRKKINKLEEDIQQCNTCVILEPDDLNAAIAEGILKELIQFSDIETDDAKILKIKDIGASIIRIVDTTAQKKYGKEVGLLWYGEES
jgi:hypothetical protein